MTEQDKAELRERITALYERVQRLYELCDPNGDDVTFPVHEIADAAGRADELYATADRLFDMMPE